GVISCRHHPLFRVLRHFDEFIVGMSCAHSEDRYGADASREQEIAHRNPPCDNAAGDRRKSTPRAAGRHPFGGKSFRQRVTAQRGAKGTSLSDTYAPSGLRIRQDSRYTDVLEAGSRRSLFLRLMDCNHHFGRLLSQPGLTPLRISASSVSCANEATLGEGRRGLLDRG